MPIQKRPLGSGKNGNSSDDEKLTPLQRYLAKQKAAELKQQQTAKTGSGKGREKAPKTTGSDSKPASESNSSRESSTVSPADEPGSFGIPSTSPPSERPPANEASKILPEPGAFLARFAAYLVDLVILTAAAKGIDRFFFGPLRWFGGPDIFGFEDSLNFILYHVLAFFYYGWFYSQKGASPGKIILQLEVGDAHSQARLGYWRAFLRESIGKYISTVPFLLGFLLAGLRRDHRALHDLIFDTQVVRKKA